VTEATLWLRQPKADALAYFDHHTSQRTAAAISDAWKALLGLRHQKLHAPIECNPDCTATTPPSESMHSYNRRADNS
jgi:hypothetical protein